MLGYQIAIVLWVAESAECYPPTSVKLNELGHWLLHGVVGIS